MNPLCPEPKCKHVMRLRKLKTDLGMSGCPNCRNSETKPYILTEKKKGMRKCLRCRKDYMPIRREGFSKFFICIEHPWQKFKVGAEVISCKTKPKTERELMKDVGSKRPFQAKAKRRPPNQATASTMGGKVNVQLRPKA